MRKKIVFSAGGTGGHLFPAQTVAEKLIKDHDVLFVAGGLKDSLFFDKESFPYQDIDSAPLSLSNPWLLPKQSLSIIKGLSQAIKILKHFQPQLVVGFGSFHSLPVLAAALICRIPILLHEQNVLPGRVNRLFSSYAKTMAISFPATAQYLQSTTTLVNFPMRTHPEVDPWAYFNWQKGEKTLLVFGGSQGAQRLNQLACHLYGFRVLHICGAKASCEEIAHHYKAARIQAQVKSFETRLDLAMQVADLAICRAGAATVSELIHYQTPAILIPFPNARDDHQWYNAKFFSQDIGGGKVIREENLDDKSLYLAISTLDLNRCRQSLKDYRENQVSQSLENLILSSI